MISKEQICFFFKKLHPHKRIDLMCGLLNLCLPLELRFLGTYLENIGKKDYYYLRDYELKANNFEEVNKLNEDDDVRLRHKLAIYTSLLYSDNTACSNSLFDILRAYIDRFIDQHIEFGQPLDFVLFQEILLILTFAFNHPSFSFDQKNVAYSQYKRLEEHAQYHFQEEETSLGSVKDTSDASMHHLRHHHLQLPHWKACHVYGGLLPLSGSPQADTVTTPTGGPRMFPVYEPALAPSDRTSPVSGSLSSSPSPSLSNSSSNLSLVTSVSQLLEQLHLVQHHPTLAHYTLEQLRNMNDEEFETRFIPYNDVQKIRARLKSLNKHHGSLRKLTDVLHDTSVPPPNYIISNMCQHAVPHLSAVPTLNATGYPYFFCQQPLHQSSYPAVLPSEDFASEKNSNEDSFSISDAEESVGQAGIGNEMNPSVAVSSSTHLDKFSSISNSVAIVSDVTSHGSPNLRPTRFISPVTDVLLNHRPPYYTVRYPPPLYITRNPQTYVYYPKMPHIPDPAFIKSGLLLQPPPPQYFPHNCQRPHFDQPRSFPAVPLDQIHSSLSSVSPTVMTCSVSSNLSSPCIESSPVHFQMHLSRAIHPIYGTPGLSNPVSDNFNSDLNERSPEANGPNQAKANMQNFPRPQKTHLNRSNSFDQSFSAHTLPMSSNRDVKYRPDRPGYGSLGHSRNRSPLTNFVSNNNARKNIKDRSTMDSNSKFTWGKHYNPDSSRPYASPVLQDVDDGSSSIYLDRQENNISGSSRNSPSSSKLSPSLVHQYRSSSPKSVLSKSYPVRPDSHENLPATYVSSTTTIPGNVRAILGQNMNIPSQSFTGDDKTNVPVDALQHISTSSNISPSKHIPANGIAPSIANRIVPYASTINTAKSHASNSKKNTCYNCGIYGHVAYQCPEHDVHLQTGSFHLNYQPNSATEATDVQLDREISQKYGHNQIGFEKN